MSGNVRQYRRISQARYETFIRDFTRLNITIRIYFTTVFYSELFEPLSERADK